MELPNLSFLSDVAKVRYLQNSFEPISTRNPDDAAELFLSPWTRLKCRAKFILLKSKVRRSPWYWYVLSRTLYYDAIFISSIFQGFSSIINIGSGADTRAIRFRRILDQGNVSVLEIDQKASIELKRQITPPNLLPIKFRFGDIDLNSEGTMRISELIGCIDGKALVVMEGVSPYIQRHRFQSLLEFLAAALPTGSIISYDFKISGIDDNFGSKHGSHDLFRLSDSELEVASFHQKIGLTTLSFARSAELMSVDAPSSVRCFGEDCLIQVSPRKL